MSATSDCKTAQEAILQLVKEGGGEVTQEIRDKAWIIASLLWDNARDYDASWDS